MEILFFVAELDEATEKKDCNGKRGLFSVVGKSFGEKDTPKNYSTLISITYFPFSFSKVTSVELAGYKLTSVYL